MTADKSQVATAAITVAVTGVPAIPPPTPPQERAAAEARITALYKEVFGVHLTAPALVRKERPGVTGPLGEHGLRRRPPLSD